MDELEEVIKEVQELAARPDVHVMHSDEYAETVNDRPVIWIRIGAIHYALYMDPILQDKNELTHRMADFSEVFTAGGIAKPDFSKLKLRDRESVVLSLADWSKLDELSEEMILKLPLSTANCLIAIVLSIESWKLLAEVGK